MDIVKEIKKIVKEMKTYEPPKIKIVPSLVRTPNNTDATLFKE